MDETISTTTKSFCLSAKFSVSITIPGLTQQLSVSKLKFCLLAVTEVWAHVTLTPVSPGTFTADLVGPIFLSGRLKNQLWADAKNLTSLRMEFTSLIPPSWLQAPPRCCFRSPREKKKASPLMKEKNIPLGEHTQNRAFLIL